MQLREMLSGCCAVSYWHFIMLANPWHVCHGGNDHTNLGVGNEGERCQSSICW